jgi:serine/threonine protein kinase
LLPPICQTAGPDANAELTQKVGEWISNKPGALSKYGPIGLWDTSNVTLMVSLFRSADQFDENLSAWDLSRVTDTSAMFNAASRFNSDLSSWDVSQARFTNQMFHDAANFSSDLSSWDVSSLETSVAMFYRASVFTSDLSSWDVARIHDMNYMFEKAWKFTSNVSSWQVQYGAETESMFQDTLVPDEYESSLPCWATTTACPLPIAFAGSRKSLQHSLGVTTVDPAKMSATNTYRVGTTYRIAPLAIKLETAHTYSLIDPPDGFYINPRTGVVIGTFGVDDVTVQSDNATDSKPPLSVTLQVIALADNRRAEVEKYIMHVEDRDTFALKLGDRIIDKRYQDQYLAEVTGEATVVLVHTPFRIAARHVDQNKTVLSEGGFDDVTFTFKVYDTTTGSPINNELERLSIKPQGELLGEFSTNEVGKLSIIITAADGGGEKFEMKPFFLDVRQLDVDIPAFGPNNKECSNNGLAVDESGDPLDGTFTSCDCNALNFVGENCDERCPEGTNKNAETGKCADEPSQSATSTILAAIAGAIVLLLLLTAGIIRYHHYQLSMQPVDFDEVNLRMLKNGTIMDGQLFSDCKPRELKRSNLVLLEKVGSGSFGAVWKAMLDESSTTRSPEYQVAAKTVLEGAPLNARTELATEAAVMAQLAGHKNLVSIIGVVTSGTPLILVLSYCDHGSLLSHLAVGIAAGQAVSVVNKLDFAAQTARGMEHLSRRHFVHRDLAARNVLLTSGQSPSNLVCKVADFGLSRVGASSERSSFPSGTDDDKYHYYRSQKGVFPVRWTAPEAMESLLFNQSSDVWSFGIVLIELVQDGDRPYLNARINSDVMSLTMSGQRHQQPPGCSDRLYAIMMRCWDADPRKRPSFTDLASDLEQLCSCAALWGEDIVKSSDGGDNGGQHNFSALQTRDLVSTSSGFENELRTITESVEYELLGCEETGDFLRRTLPEYEPLVRGCHGVEHAVPLFLADTNTATGLDCNGDDHDKRKLRTTFVV